MLQLSYKSVIPEFGYFIEELIVTKMVVFVTVIA